MITLILWFGPPSGPWAASISLASSLALFARFGQRRLTLSSINFDFCFPRRIKCCADTFRVIKKYSKVIKDSIIKEGYVRAKVCNADILLRVLFAEKVIHWDIVIVIGKSVRLFVT